MVSSVLVHPYLVQRSNCNGKSQLVLYIRSLMAVIFTNLRCAWVFPVPGRCRHSRKKGCRHLPVYEMCKHFVMGEHLLMLWCPSWKSNFTGRPLDLQVLSHCWPCGIESNNYMDTMVFLFRASAKTYSRIKNVLVSKWSENDFNKSIWKNSFGDWKVYFL